MQLMAVALLALHSVLLCVYCLSCILHLPFTPNILKTMISMVTKLTSYAWVTNAVGYIMKHYSKNDCFTKIWLCKSTKNAVCNHSCLCLISIVMIIRYILAWNVKYSCLCTAVLCTLSWISYLIKDCSCYYMLKGKLMMHVNL